MENQQASAAPSGMTPWIPETAPVYVTPAMARAWLAGAQYLGQRKIREYRVREFVREIERGAFRRSVISLRRVGERLILADGQHRLHAIARTGVTAPMDVVIHTVSLDDVAKDFATMDRPLIRSHADNLAPFNFGEIGLSRTHESQLSPAAPIVVAGFQAGAIHFSARSSMERADFVREWAAEALAISEATGEAHTRAHAKKMKNAPVYAVMLVTFRFAPDEARNFWARLAEDDGLRKGDPAKTLLDFLLTHRSRGRSYAFLTRAVAACWNADFEGRRLLLIRVNDTAMPIRIAGTPFKGDAVVKYEDLLACRPTSA